MPRQFVSEPIELRRWAWWRWPWRGAIILKACECRAGTLRGRQLRRARLDVLRDIHMHLPGIWPTPTSDPDVSLEQEYARRFDEMAASLSDKDTWHSLSLEAMAQGRGLDFAIREREYREQAAQEVRDRAAALLDRLGAYAKAILRQSRYRVVGYRAEADTGHVERNRTTLTADDFAVFAVDLSNGCLVVPGVGLKYLGVTIREFQIADGASSTAAESVRGAGENRSQASTDKAACRVGRSLFGDTWIGSLTGRERWLIERYVDRQETSSIIASGVTFFGPGGPIPAVNDPALRAEIEAALDRRDWMKSQYDRAYDWLESRGFDIESDTLDADAFRRAFVSRFPAEIAPSARPKDHDKKAVSSPLSPSLASARSCGPRKRGRKPTVRESVTAKMLSDIDANSITREQLGAMQEKILSERYGVSRDTARKARNDVLGGS